LNARWQRGTAALLAIPLLLGLASCGAGDSTRSQDSSNPASTASPLPPRPTELRLDNVNPCALLSNVDRSQLKLNLGKFSYDEDSAHYAICQWSNFPTDLGVPDMS
jgi:hypothetical protein